METVADLAGAYLEVVEASQVSGPWKFQSQATAADMIAVCGAKPAGEFSAGDFVAVRDQVATARRRALRGNTGNRAASTVNARMGFVRQMFRWAACEGRVSLDVIPALMDVPELPTVKPEPKPADLAAVAATLPFLPPYLQAAIRLQALVGLRTGEIVTMRPADIDSSRGTPTVRAKCRQCRKGNGPCPRHADWFYRGPARDVRIGPDAQRILSPFMTGPPLLPMFSPRDGVRWRRGRSGDPTRYGYTTVTYPRAVRDAITAARAAGVSVTAWTPSQLLPLTGTDVAPPDGGPRPADPGALMPLNRVTDLLPWVVARGDSLRRWNRAGVKSPAGQIVKLRAEKHGKNFYTTEGWVREFIAAAGWKGNGSVEPVSLRDIPKRFPWAAVKARGDGRWAWPDWERQGLLTPPRPRVFLRAEATKPPGGRVARTTTEADLRAFFAALDWPTPPPTPGVDMNDPIPLKLVAERLPWVYANARMSPCQMITCMHKHGVVPARRRVWLKVERRGTDCHGTTTEADLRAFFEAMEWPTDQTAAAQNRP